MRSKCGAGSLVQGSRPFLFGAVCSAVIRGAACILKCGVPIATGSDALLAYGLRPVDHLESDWQECFPESEHDMSEAGMLREMKIDERAEGLFILALRRPAKEDGLPREYGSGPFGASSTRSLNADDE